jgi:hypothetical protein
LVPDPSGRYVRGDVLIRAYFRWGAPACARRAMQMFAQRQRGQSGS